MKLDLKELLLKLTLKPDWTLLGTHTPTSNNIETSSFAINSDTYTEILVVGPLFTAVYPNKLPSATSMGGVFNYSSGYSYYWDGSISVSSTAITLSQRVYAKGGLITWSDCAIKIYTR